MEQPHPSPACLLGLFISLALSGGASAEDWPTYLHDNQRSAVTSEALGLPLKPAWVHESRNPPKPAWAGGPAKQNFWWELENLAPKVDHDSVFHVVSAGDSVFFSSSADDQVYCLDAATGRERWRFFTSGSVRLAPSVSKGRVFVGSDDGFVYCLDAGDGSLVWKARAGPGDGRILGNGRMISRWPVRTGVIVEDGQVYFGAGLFPREGVFLRALHAGDGSEIWKTSPELSFQGYPLSSATRLYVPTGRTTPSVFDRKTGKLLGTVKGEGGAYALVNEELLFHGPGHTGTVELFDTASQDVIAAFRGRHVIVTGTRTFLHSGSEVTALDRVRYVQLSREKRERSLRRAEIGEALKKLGAERSSTKARALKKELEEVDMGLEAIAKGLEACLLWTEPCGYPLSMILAGDSLFAGGEDGVAALSTKDGALLWTASVRGQAHGLSAANGRLFVSTDQGFIHAFEQVSGAR